MTRTPSNDTSGGATSTRIALAVEESSMGLTVITCGAPSHMIRAERDRWRRRTRPRCGMLATRPVEVFPGHGCSRNPRPETRMSASVEVVRTSAGRTWRVADRVSRGTEQTRYPSSRTDEPARLRRLFITAFKTLPIAWTPPADPANSQSSHRIVRRQAPGRRGMEGNRE